MFSEYLKNYMKKEKEGKDNDFTKLINLCKYKGRNFVNTLLKYERMDNNILFCYLNIAMTSTATVKFKERMTYEKLSDAATIFEEAFAALVFENNFDRWVYFANQKLNRVNENETNDDDSSQSVGSIINSGSDESNDEPIPDVLYQQKIKKSKDKKREAAGKWTPEGMERLNELITMVQEGRNEVARDEFEEGLQQQYVDYAEENLDMNKNKRKRDLEQMNQRRRKTVVVQNILDLVAL